MYIYIPLKISSSLLFTTYTDIWEVDVDIVDLRHGYPNPNPYPTLTLNP
jgi:hypothetical protein